MLIVAVIAGLLMATMGAFSDGEQDNHSLRMAFVICGALVIVAALIVWAATL